MTRADTLATPARIDQAAAQELIDAVEAYTKACEELAQAELDDRMIRNLTPEDYVASDQAARTLVQEGVCVYYAGKADLLSAVLRRQGEVTRHAVGDSLLGITYRLEALE